LFCGLNRHLFDYMLGSFLCSVHVLLMAYALLRIPWGFPGLMSSFLYLISILIDIASFSVQGLLGRRTRSNSAWLRRKRDVSRRGRGERWRHGVDSNREWLLYTSPLDITRRPCRLKTSHGQSDRHLAGNSDGLVRCKQQPQALPWGFTGDKSIKKTGRWATQASWQNVSRSGSWTWHGPYLNSASHRIGLHDFFWPHWFILLASKGCLIQIVEFVWV